ncbi:MAG: LytTR family transcriptional regulator DNA-binding domain-containing protein [Clostridia bacterium]|nr:LytTR family transcriptional regulator DNA-binding domain-containing protein [Clostridia bacterium]
MLPVIIFEPNQETRRHLKGCVQAYSSTHDTSMSLLADTESLNDAVRYLNGEDGISLMMLSVAAGKDETRRGAVQLGRAAIRKNRDNYTLFCLHNPMDLESLLNTGVRPVGVLVRPFEKEKLEKLLLRIDKDYQEIREESQGECLVVDSGNSTYRVPYSRILYIEALDKKLNIWTERQTLTVRMTLNTLEETMPKDLFFRCHRSYLVNIQCVERVDFTDMVVFLTSGDDLPLARSARDRLREILETERKGGRGA